MVRTLGGLVISHIGDRYGRKPALIFSITLMGISVACEMNGMLVAGPTPLMSVFLVEIAGGKPTYVAIFQATCCLLTAFAAYKLAGMQEARQGKFIATES